MVGSEGSNPGQFSYTDGVAFDGAGHVLASDTNHDRVQVFTEEGAYVTSITGLHRPRGVCVDCESRILIGGYDRKVTVFGFPCE